MRNQSIFVDLFHGQLKSQVRCLQCNHTSVKFDPFTFLSLPLPLESCLHLEVIGRNISIYGFFKLKTLSSVAGIFYRSRCFFVTSVGLRHVTIELVGIAYDSFNVRFFFFYLFQSSFRMPLVRSSTDWNWTSRTPSWTSRFTCRISRQFLQISSSSSKFTVPSSRYSRLFPTLLEIERVLVSGVRGSRGLRWFCCSCRSIGTFHSFITW